VSLLRPPFWGSEKIELNKGLFEEFLGRVQALPGRRKTPIRYSELRMPKIQI
jgi:hypothetical protein